MAATKPIQIFLCHASEDKAAVETIYDRLKGLGYSPWLDKKDLLPGQRWRVEIPKALRASDYILICLSKASVAKRGYVQNEFKLALEVLQEIPEGTIYGIPVRLDDCPIPDLLVTCNGVTSLRQMALSTSYGHSRPGGLLPSEPLWLPNHHRWVTQCQCRQCMMWPRLDSPSSPK
jgi:hypothetical protein